MGVTVSECSFWEEDEPKSRNLKSKRKEVCRSGSFKVLVGFCWMKREIKGDKVRRSRGRGDKLGFEINIYTLYTKQVNNEQQGPTV